MLRNPPCGRDPSLACGRPVGHRSEMVRQELGRLFGAVLASDAGVVVERLPDPFGVCALAVGMELVRLIPCRSLDLNLRGQLVHLPLEVLDATGEGFGLVKESSILPAVDEWLAGLFTDEQIDTTCAAVETALGPDPADEALEIATRRKLRECDAKLARYRQALEARTDASIVSGWIEEVQLERRAAELQLRRRRGDGRMTSEEIRSLVEQVKGIVAILQGADPEDRRAVYQELNVSITYHTDGRLHVKAGPSACTNDRVGGGI